MPYRNPGKKAFAVILSLAAVTGVVFYTLASIASPEPISSLEPLEQDDDGLSPPAGIAENGTAAGVDESVSTEPLDDTTIRD